MGFPSLLVCMSPSRLQSQWGGMATDQKHTWLADQHVSQAELPADLPQTKHMIHSASEEFLVDPGLSTLQAKRLPIDMPT